MRKLNENNTLIIDSPYLNALKDNLTILGIVLIVLYTTFYKHTCIMSGLSEYIW